MLEVDGVNRARLLEQLTARFGSVFENISTNREIEEIRKQWDTFKKELREEMQTQIQTRLNDGLVGVEQRVNAELMPALAGFESRLNVEKSHKDDALGKMEMKLESIEDDNRDLHRDVQNLRMDHDELHEGIAEKFDTFGVNLLQDLQDSHLSHTIEESAQAEKPDGEDCYQSTILASPPEEPQTNAESQYLIDSTYQRSEYFGKSAGRKRTRDSPTYRHDRDTYVEEDDSGNSGSPKRTHRRPRMQPSDEIHSSSPAVSQPNPHNTSHQSKNRGPKAKPCSEETQLKGDLKRTTISEKQWDELMDIAKTINQEHNERPRVQDRTWIWRFIKESEACECNQWLEQYLRKRFPEDIKADAASTRAKSAKHKIDVGGLKWSQVYDKFAKSCWKQQRLRRLSQNAR